MAAGPLLVASETRSAFLVAAAAFLQRIPWLLLGLPAGVIVDRVDRRLLLVCSEGCRALVVIVLALGLVVDLRSVPWALAAMFSLGVSDVFSNTTSGTLLPMLVENDDLGLANSRLQGTTVLCQQLIGPPIGAVLFSLGRAWPFLAQAVIVTAALVLVWQIGARQVRAEGRHGTHIRSDIREGIQWLAAHPPVRTLALTILSFNITWGAAWSVLRVIAQRWGVVAPFWFGFAGSGLTLLAVWRQLGQIAHI